MTSHLTYRILAFAKAPGFHMNDCVDWAVEMMELGYEGENLHILAGLVKPVLYIEAIDYLKAALKEVNLKEVEGDDAIISYASYYIHKIAEGNHVRENTETIRDFCIESNYDDILYDFYLLGWAWSDIEYGMEYQAYWPEANKDNIEQITIEKAQQWLVKHKSIYKKLLQA